MIPNNVQIDLMNSMVTIYDTDSQTSKLDSGNVDEFHNTNLYEFDCEANTLYIFLYNSTKFSHLNYPVVNVIYNTKDTDTKVFLTAGNDKNPKKYFKYPLNTEKLKDFLQLSAYVKITDKDYNFIHGLYIPSFQNNANIQNVQYLNPNLYKINIM